MTQWTGASLSGKYQATPSTLTDGTQTQLLTDNKGAVVLGPGTNTVGTVNVAGTVPVSGTFWPATQPVSGTVSVSNFPASQAVTGTFWQATQPVSGSVSVSNFPASQAVTGTFWPATQPVSGTVSVGNFPATQAVTGTFWQATQPVSLTSLPTLAAGTNTIGNVKLTDGTNTASVDASGNQKVNLTTSLPAGTATIGSVQVTDGTRTATIDATTNAIRTYTVNSATSVTSTSQVLAPDEPTVGLGTVQPLATDNHRRLILSPTVGGRPNVWRQGHVTLAANTLTSLTNATAVPTLTPAAPAQAIEYTVPANVSSRLVQAYLVLDNPPNNVTVTMTLTFGGNQTRIACSSGTNYIWNRQFLAAPSLSAGQTITIQLLATAVCSVGVFLEIAEDVA